MDAEEGTETITITVRVNGTNVNHHHRMGLKQNPFPQIGKAEYDKAERQINSLDGDPVKSAEDIRERLQGFGSEFIDLCIANYRPGKRTAFQVTFPARRS